MGKIPGSKSIRGIEQPPQITTVSRYTVEIEYDMLNIRMVLGGLGWVCFVNKFCVYVHANPNIR